MYGTEIPKDNCIKYLDLYFDTQLNWRMQLKEKESIRF